MRCSRWLVPLAFVCLFLASWAGPAWADVAPDDGDDGCGCAVGASLADPMGALASVAAGGALLWGLRRRR
jgi:hypothetical protein